MWCATSADLTTGDLERGRPQINVPIHNDVFYFFVLRAAWMAHRRNKGGRSGLLLQPITERTSVGPPSVVKPASALRTPSLGRLRFLPRGFCYASDPKNFPGTNHEEE